MEIEIYPGATDEETEDDLGAQTVEKTVSKSFRDIIYDQTQVDPYSCTVVATYTAISNKTGKIVSYDLMRNTLERMENDGKFRKGFGAKLSDGVKYALEDYNREFKTSLKAVRVTVSASSLVKALRISPVVSGLYYGKKFVEDTQDNAWIDGAIEGVKGAQGHACTYVKINTMDDWLVKMCNTYAGKLANNVFGFDLTKYRSMLFNTGYYFE